MRFSDNSTTEFCLIHSSQVIQTVKQPFILSTAQRTGHLNITGNNRGKDSEEARDVSVDEKTNKQTNMNTQKGVNGEIKEWIDKYTGRWEDRYADG